MKFQVMILASVLGVVGVELPSLAQGAFVTTVNVFSTGQSGHNEVQGQQQDSTQQFYNGFSLTTDSQRDSSTNKTVEDGKTTVETYTYGETVTGYTIEKGDFNRTQTVDYFEAYDYTDFSHVHTLTTGARGERGPERANDRNLRRR